MDDSGGCCNGRDSQSHTSSLESRPNRQRHSTAKRVAPPPYNRSAAPGQRNMAQMKEQIKTPEKELSNEMIANLIDREFKALVIKMLTDLIELG